MFHVTCYLTLCEICVIVLRDVCYVSRDLCFVLRVHLTQVCICCAVSQAQTGDTTGMA